MGIAKAFLYLVWLVPGLLLAQQATVTELMSKELSGLPGKEGLMITVTYPPGGADPVHRHNAHGFIYVLEGSIVMQVKGGKEVTLTPGQTFYEGPNDIHSVGRNASRTIPAKFLVFLVKDKGAPVLIPVHYNATEIFTSVQNLQENDRYEHNYYEGRHFDLLQGLGDRTDHPVLARLAVEFGRLGWPAPLSCRERFSRDRA